MPRPSKNTVKPRAEAIRKRIKDATGQPTREYRVEGHPGLVLFTRKSGIGKFYYVYRMPKQKQQRFDLGQFGPTTLADATQRAIELRAMVGRGENPKQSHNGMTFKEMAEKFVAESQTLKSSTRVNYRYDLKKNIYPAIGSKAAADVTPDDVLAICRDIKTRGSNVQAQRTKTTIGGVYRWGINERYVKHSPAKEVAAQAPTSVRKRTPDDDEIGTLWNALDKTGLHPSLKLIVRLGIITGQRRTEVAAVRVDELDFDKGEWRIPGDDTVAGRRIEGRTKNGREQIVYLSKQAQALFREAMKTTRDGDYLFPADSRAKALPHINPQSVTKAVQRLREQFDVDDITIHDMRRALGNWCKDSNYSIEVRDLLLNHLGQRVDDIHYSSSARMEKQCRAAWQGWADHVESVVG